MIDNAAEQIGAIAGIVDDPLDGSVTGNTFVDGGCRGHRQRQLPGHCRTAGRTRISVAQEICPTISAASVSAL